MKILDSKKRLLKKNTKSKTFKIEIQAEDTFNENASQNEIRQKMS